jgi:hypothetical protein
MVNTGDVDSYAVAQESVEAGMVGGKRVHSRRKEGKGIRAGRGCDRRCLLAGRIGGQDYYGARNPFRQRDPLRFSVPFR